MRDDNWADESVLTDDVSDEAVETAAGDRKTQVSFTFLCC